MLCNSRMFALVRRSSRLNREDPRDGASPGPWSRFGSSRTRLRTSCTTVFLERIASFSRSCLSSFSTMYIYGLPGFKDAVTVDRQQWVRMQTRQLSPHFRQTGIPAIFRILSISNLSPAFILRYNSGSLNCSFEDYNHRGEGSIPGPIIKSESSTDKADLDQERG